MAVRVVRLQASNFKRIRAVDISPDPNVVVLTGANGEGKSSVLDAVFAAIAGAKALKVTETTHPVREGEEEATIRLDLGDVRVKRVWSAGGKTAVTLTNAEGARFSSPQGMLDNLIGALSFDPLAFANARPQDQLAMLVDLVDLPFDPEEQDQKRQTWYDQRTEVGREVKVLAAQIEGFQKPREDLPTAEVSAADLLAEMTKAQATMQAWQDVHDRADKATAIVRDRAEMVAEAERRLDEARMSHEEAVVLATAAQAERDALPDPPTLAPIQQRIEEVDATNAAIRRAKQRADLVEEHRLADARHGDLNLQIEELDASRRKAMSEAKMPIEGLDFGAGQVIYQGVPFGQASMGEKIRVSIAIAMAMNPDLRVLRIEDASLLDTDNLALIEQMARDHDYQAWIERVESDDPMAIHIEDGAVVEVAAE